MRRTVQAFTLAELLIALFILGVIATFSIPKVLTAQQNIKYAAIGKEAAAALSSAFTAYQMDNTVDANTGFSDLTPYLNYIKVQTSGTIDASAGSTGSLSCASASPCYQLANGSMIRDPYKKTTAGTGNHFGGTTSTYYIYFNLDPNGTLDDTILTNGPGKSVTFEIFANGRLTSLYNCPTGSTTYLDNTSYNSWCPGTDPTWFSW